MNEIELVRHIADGKSSKMIASLMGYAEITIETYRFRMYKKYRAGNAPHLVSIFYEMGKLKPLYGNETDHQSNKSEIREAVSAIPKQKGRKNYQMELFMLMRRNMHKGRIRPKIREKSELWVSE